MHQSPLLGHAERLASPAVEGKNDPILNHKSQEGSSRVVSSFFLHFPQLALRLLESLLDDGLCDSEGLFPTALTVVTLADCSQE